MSNYKNRTVKANLYKGLFQFKKHPIFDFGQFSTFYDILCELITQIYEFSKKNFQSCSLIYKNSLYLISGQKTNSVLKYWGRVLGTRRAATDSEEPGADRVNCTLYKDKRHWLQKSNQSTVRRCYVYDICFDFEIENPYDIIFYTEALDWPIIHDPSFSLFLFFGWCLGDLHTP